MHEPQGANMWVMGMLASGRAKTADEAMRAWAAKTFGEEAAEEMADLLGDTGEVIAEALSVDTYTFGDARQPPPATIAMDKADNAKANAFHHNWSNFRWDPAYRPSYEAARDGAKTIIDAEQTGTRKSVESAENSLKRLEAVKEKLTPEAYAFYQGKLETNLIFAQTMGEIQLAYLKRRHTELNPDTELSKTYAKEIDGHVTRLRELAKAGRKYDVKWGGWRRGGETQFIKVDDWLKRFGVAE